MKYCFQRELLHEGMDPGSGRHLLLAQSPFTISGDGKSGCDHCFTARGNGNDIPTVVRKFAKTLDRVS